MANSNCKDTEHRIFVDAHVHIHESFSLPAFFDAAVYNFQKASSEVMNSGSRNCFIMLLSEGAGKNCFKKLCEFADKGRFLSGQNGLVWCFKRTSEQEKLQVCRSDGRNIFLMAGRQLITAEKLEVLALMTTDVFLEKQPLSQTVQGVRQNGGLPVVPWGFGKWFGKRGRILKKFLMENDKPMFLGDNGGRPALWPRPELFALVESKGGRVLPGSDTLPLPFDASRVGSFGFTMNASLSSHLVRDLKKCLDDTKTSLEAYGKSEKITRFIRNQLLIRILSLKKAFKRGYNGC